MELGILLALVAAIFSSLKGVARKHVSRDFSSVEIGYLGQVYGAILIFPFALYRYSQVGITITPGILTALLGATAVVLASTYIYVEALRIADVSVTEPLRNTSPIFVALLEPLILGINFKALILMAALLGATGAYVLLAKDSLIDPVENINNKGALLSILVAFILSLYSLASRFGATNTDPLLFIYLTYISGLVGFWLWKKKESESIELESYLRKDVFVMGSVTALGAVAGVYAYSIISASEASVVMQTSTLFSVIIGGRFFKEEDLLRKTIGAIIILAGVLLVVI